MKWAIIFGCIVSIDGDKDIGVPASGPFFFASLAHVRSLCVCLCTLNVCVPSEYPFVLFMYYLWVSTVYVCSVWVQVRLSLYVCVCPLYMIVACACLHNFQIFERHNILRQSHESSMFYGQRGTLKLVVKPHRLTWCGPRLYTKLDIPFRSGTSSVASSDVWDT